MLNIPVDEKKITDEQVLMAFDLSYPGLEQVKTAVRERNYDMAKRELVSYFHTRSNVSFLFDYRGTPLKPVEKPVNHYFFQAACGLRGDFEDFMVLAGKNIMDHIYVLPGDRTKPVDLGAHFETAPHFNFFSDEGIRSRTPSNMFTRGQWMEYLFVLYQNTGDCRVAEKFQEFLQYFFEDYALLVEDTGVQANRFQYTEDRTVMSVGWLTVSYIELLYTEMAYAVDVNTTFDIIKHLWFLGSQFRRFRDDTYRPYNHHLWERGLMPFLLGTIFPEIPGFAAMKTQGAVQVCRHVKDDFNTHGGYNEHSIAYWSGAALGEMLFRGMYLARLNQEPLLDREAAERIEKSFQALVLMAPPSRHYAAIGDGMGALTDKVLVLGEQMADHDGCRELLRYRRGIQPEPPSFPLYYSDHEVGFTCGRTDFGPQATYFLMSTKVRCGGSGHNHMDMLSLNLTVRGEEFIGEPYAGYLYPKVRMGSRERGYLYNMTSHNTVLAYGNPIAGDEMYAAQWGVRRPDSPVTAYSTCPEGMYAEAVHDGYSYCRHTRRILFGKHGNMMVKDEIKPGSRVKKAHIQRWHLLPGISCRKEGETAVVLEKAGVKLLCIWIGAKEIVLWKDDEILCQEMYQSKEMLGYNLDVMFGEQKAGDAEELVSSVDTAFIDITDRAEYEIGDIAAGFQKAGTAPDSTVMLEFLNTIS